MKTHSIYNKRKQQIINTQICVCSHDLPLGGRFWVSASYQCIAFQLQIHTSLPVLQKWRDTFFLCQLAHGLNFISTESWRFHVDRKGFSSLLQYTALADSYGQVPPTQPHLTPPVALQQSASGFPRNSLQSRF